MSNITINNALVFSFNKIIIDEHNSFLEHIYLKYGKLGNFTLQELYDRYHIDYIFLSPNESKKYTRPTTPTPENRCMARCWGGAKSVKFDQDSKKWKYGYQCHKRKTNLTDYCGIHLREINKGYLTHGRIDGPVPHPHYNKYQKKIEIQNAIKKV